MKTDESDNIEIARNLLNIIDWCLKCQQIENKNTNDDNCFSYAKAWNEYKKSDDYKKTKKIILNTGNKINKNTKKKGK